MNQEKILKSLTNLGLKKAEAKVYFYLSKRGPKKANEIINALGITKQRLYPIIKNLQNKAIINATLDRPAKFSVVSLEKVLDSFAKAKIEEAKIIQQNKDKLLSDWQSIATPEIKDVSAKFTVIKGRNCVYSKIQQMIMETKSQFFAISNLSELFRVEQFGILDEIQNHPMKSEIQFHFITEVTKQNLKPIKNLMENLNPRLKLKGRNIDIGLSLFPRIFIRDKKEILYFISTRTDQSEDREDYVCLFTNCLSLVKPFTGVFENLWNSSTDIEQKINEVETGKLPPRTIIIGNTKAAKNKYEEVLKKAKNEILLVTSPNALIEFSKDLTKFSDWVDRGISIKIMAPIIGRNLKAAQKLSRCCQIRHVPVCYSETTIIDGKHLFQFKNTQSIMNEFDSTQLLENTFYTNDQLRIEKTENMLKNIWKNSSAPSGITIQSVFNHPTSPNNTESLESNNYQFKFHRDVSNSDIYNEMPLGKITEQDVINKIISTKRNPITDTPPKNIVTCCSIGFALIHPPSFFNLPDTLIGALHIDKKSTFGAEDALMIHFKLNTPEGFKYVPMAILGDNPKAKKVWTTQTRGTPAEKNYHLMEKDQIQIQVYGNTLFAEWTEPITIVPGKYILPPSAILLEAYGKIRTHSYSTVSPSKIRNNWAMNNFEAFVTFTHKESKYTGPGTDGLFIRDAYIELIMP